MDPRNRKSAAKNRLNYNYHTADESVRMEWPASLYIYTHAATAKVTLLKGAVPASATLNGRPNGSLYILCNACTIIVILETIHYS